MSVSVNAVILAIGFGVGIGISEKASGWCQCFVSCLHINNVSKSIGYIHVNVRRLSNSTDLNSAKCNKQSSCSSAHTRNYE